MITKLSFFKLANSLSNVLIKCKWWQFKKKKKCINAIYEIYLTVRS